MSFGKKKMHEISDELASSVLIAAHRGNGEWMVISISTENPTGICFHFGCASPRSDVKFKAARLADISDHFRPWAKALQKQYLRSA